jgi:Sigma-70 region 2
VTAKAHSTGTVSCDSPATRDAELIARILGGERELFHELVRPYEKSVYLAAFSILQNQQDAEDAAQKKVLKALKNLAIFAPSRSSAPGARSRVRRARLYSGRSPGDISST